SGGAADTEYRRVARVAGAAARAHVPGKAARRDARAGTRTAAQLLRGAAPPRRGERRPNANVRSRRAGAAFAQRLDQARRPPRARPPPGALLLRTRRTRLLRVPDGGGSGARPRGAPNAPLGH